MALHNCISTQNPEEVQNACKQLSKGIARWTITEEKLTTAIPGLFLSRYDDLTEPRSFLHEPSICVVAQGAKRVYLGGEEYVYDANHYLISSIDVPVVAQVIEKPYLGLMLKLDLSVVTQLIVNGNLPSPRLKPATRGLAIGEVTVELLNAFQRLLTLLDTPEDIPVLGPNIQREILYRLLVGEQGPRLRQIAINGNHSHQISQAIKWLKENYKDQLHVGNLAMEIGMSLSSFHQHFRTLTAMSPLQYQKSVRLHEARRIMLSERLDAATTAFQVGYESPSQFSREYSRLFGAPPLRDIKNLNQLSEIGSV